VNSNVLTGFQHKICDVLRSLSLQDLSDNSSNSNINKELTASYHSYAIFGMIIAWINGGFKYSPSYMSEQLLAILNTNNASVVYKASIEKKE
jgi:hypothetical protein